MVFAKDGTQIVYNLGDMSFVICSMALVWFMIPGVGFFYSGLLRRKNALSMIYTSLASVAVVSFQVRSLVHQRFGLIMPTFFHEIVVFLGLFVSI